MHHNKFIEVYTIARAAAFSLNGDDSHLTRPKAFGVFVGNHRSSFL
jgi:hypothetical protein